MKILNGKVMDKVNSYHSFNCGTFSVDNDKIMSK